MAKCKFIKADGKQCGRYASVGKEFCLFHDPDPVAKAKTKIITSKGGKVERAKFGKINDIPTTREALMVVCGTAIKKLYEGECAPQVAQSLSALCRMQYKLIEEAPQTKLDNLTDEELKKKASELIDSLSAEDDDE